MFYDAAKRDHGQSTESEQRDDPASEQDPWRGAPFDPSSLKVLTVNDPIFSVLELIRNGVICLSVFAFLRTFSHAHQNDIIVPNLASFPDSEGVIRTFSANGDLDLTGSFFQSLGTNGRSCGTCHQLSDAMTVAAAHVQARFDASRGLDPIFRTNDGSNCDHDIDVSTLAGRSDAYSLLRTRGLIRVALGPPAERHFEIMHIQNQYGCNETDLVSMYRRPLPAT